MNTKIFLFLIFVALILQGCKDEPVESCCLTTCDCAPSDTLIFTFGHFYGECIGEGCVEIFRVDVIEMNLSEDISDQYPQAATFYEGNFSLDLPIEKYYLVKDLYEYIPEGLYSEGTVVGQPDAGDWGGLYFEIKFNDKHRFWLLDQMKSNVPEAYHQFIDEINERIYYINL